MFTTVDQFYNDFRIKNNQFPNETVLNRGIMRLKREIRELKSVLDCILGKGVEPWHEDKVYEIDEYVSYNGIIYRSNLDSNVAMNPQTSGFWDQMSIETVKSRNQAFKFIEHISDGKRRRYETPFQMDSTPAVFADGLLLSPTKFTWDSGGIDLRSPVGNLKPVTIIAGLSYEAVTVQPKQVFTAEDQQWHFETRFQLSSPAIFVDGLYCTEGFIFGSNFVDFDEPLKEGTVVCVVNGAVGGVDLYSAQDIDAMLSRHYTKDETYNRSEIDSEILNNKNAVLNDPSLAKSAETYTKPEVDALVSGIDVSDQINALLDTKADKAESLSGYGIKDAYDKGSIDVKLQSKLDVINFNAANILDAIRDAEGPGTGLNADTLKGIKPEQFVRRDRPSDVALAFGVRGDSTKLDLNANGDVEVVRSHGPDVDLSYDFLNELNAKGSIVIIEGDFKGVWWDDIRNFGIQEPELYHWVIEVHPLFSGHQFDFVPKTYGDGFLFKAWKEEGASGTFSYGFLDSSVVKLYSVAKLDNGLFQDVPAHYILKGYRNNISVKFNRNQGDAPISASSFLWDPENQRMDQQEIEIPEVHAPNILDDNALSIIQEPILHEEDSTNLIQTVPQDHITLRYEANEYMDEDDYWIRVRGGVPNQAVRVDIANGSLISTPAAFDALGELVFSVRGLDPLEFGPTITIESSRCYQLSITPKVKKA